MLNEPLKVNGYTSRGSNFGILTFATLLKRDCKIEIIKYV